jgi:hypothetical protein
MYPRRVAAQAQGCSWMPVYSSLTRVRGCQEASPTFSQLVWALLRLYDRALRSHTWVAVQVRHGARLGSSPGSGHYSGGRGPCRNVWSQP